nr:hypothetical protein [Tanacetum cinerariifolium]
MEHEVPNRRDDVNDFEDYDQKDGELPDLPTFSATDEFASNSKQVKENIDITDEKEEVPMKDVEMDENHNIDHSGTEVALQWSFAKDPFLIVMELNDLSGAKNLRKMEHEVPNRRDDVNDFKDYDQKDGELPDLPTFYATDEFASNSKQVEENIDITEEKEEVPMKDVEMDENHNIDHSGTEVALQWSFAKDPFLIVMKLNDLSGFLLHTIP